MLKIYSYFALTACLLLLAVSAHAGTTGKIAGKVTDTQTGEALVGVNVVLEKTLLGAATDIGGFYYINNIPPGDYSVIMTLVGYQRTVVKNVRVSIDQTTSLSMTLSPSSVQIDEMVVTAERPLVQKDLTSSSVTISAKDMKVLPVENVNQVINLQAGVVSGHFRGGRNGEVSYLVDGVTITDPYNGGQGMQVDNSAVQEMEVISGTFNAEYGQAMSGIVNIVTKDGAQEFAGSASAYLGGHMTGHSDLFPNLGKPTNGNAQNAEFSLSGPVTPVENLSFFSSGRYLKESGYLYGQRVYNVTDVNGFRPTGDGQYVPMNPSERYSINGKLTYNISTFKMSYGLYYEDNKNKYYDHYFSRTPDGTLTHYRYSNMNTLQFTHVLSKSTFQNLKFSYSTLRYEGYLHEDPADTTHEPGAIGDYYVNPTQGLARSGYTFRHGGNDGSRYERGTMTGTAQWSLSSQLSREHKLGVGFEARQHVLKTHSMSITNVSTVDSVFTLGYPAYGVITEDAYNTGYTKRPLELSGYIQDKMEYSIMIVNAGLRFDYFKSNSSQPLDKRNPSNIPGKPGAGKLAQAKAKVQLSPRLGISFPITDLGILHFSYGHFFQIPNFDYLYTNAGYYILKGGRVSSITGNPDLEPQKTVTYEVGLQQVIFPDVTLDATAYYRDIRNLLGQEIVSTYDGNAYARYINRDYANVRGVILSIDKRLSSMIGAKLDYTYQIAEGNASDPMAVFNDNQTDQPRESEKKVVPLDWDQRHTVNLSLIVGNPNDLTAGAIFQFGSGLPYTQDPRISQGVQFENGGVRPTTFNLDLRLDKVFHIGSRTLNTFMIIYNALDIQNEYGVYASTGRAGWDLNTKYNQGTPDGLNSVDEYVRNPAMYSEPRQIRFGLSVGF